MINEIDFLKDLINRWDNSLEQMSGVDGRIYRSIQDRLEYITKHNNDLKKVCPKCDKQTLSEIEKGTFGCEDEDCSYIGKHIIKS